jgi:hypothetical protein
LTRSFEVLRRVANAPAPSPQAGQRCQMCADPIADAHQHVVNVEGRQLMCVCRNCYLLFTDRSAALRYRSVPDRYLSFPDVTIGQAEWDELDIPVGLAFFFRNSVLGRTVACYPGPAGATESELPQEPGRAVWERHPEIEAPAEDVEALLIRMPGPGVATAACLLLPIDACYELVGRIRLLWRGFDGGQEVRRYLEDFFDTVSARARRGGGR